MTRRLEPWFSGPLRGSGVRPEDLAAAIADGLGLELDPEVEEIVRLYLEALDTALALGTPQLLVEQLLWQQDRVGVVAPTVSRRDFVVSTTAALARHLDGSGWAEANRLMSRTVQELRDRRQVPLPEAADHSGATELTRTGRELLRLGLAGDRRGALELVLAEREFGVGPDELVVDVLGPVMVEVGRLWQRGEIGVHQQRHCSVVCDQAMAILFPPRLDAPVGRHAVTACVAHAMHDLGIRMVNDMLTLDGWSTTYLGPDTPAKETVAVVVKERPDLLAVSASMPHHVPHVRLLIQLLRADERTARVPVVVGGRPFLAEPRLVEIVGADGTGADARVAVRVCNRLVPPSWDRHHAGAP